MNNSDPLLRQQHLQRRSAQLRIAFARQAQTFKAPLALADQVRGALQWLRRHPQWPVAALLTLLILRPRRALVWSGRLWWAWKMFKRARAWMASSQARQMR